MPDSRITELYEMDGENKRRLRDIEQRLITIDNSVKRADASLLELKNKVLEISTANKSDKTDFDSKVKELENIISDIVNNMKRLAEKSDVAGLKELIDIYNPVKSKFITREEAENLIEEKIRR
ncbi:MAG TPA: hypothetical protein VJB06_02955 [archaeon]|nr:hypothetical protein [archaeon]